MANIISVFNLAQKSGKTTSAYHLARSLAFFSKSVLLVDTCFQKGLNNYFLGKDLSDKSSLQDLFSEIKLVNLFEFDTENIKISFIPYQSVDEKIDNHKIFARNLEKIASGFDYVIIDTSSFYSSLNDLILSISNSILIPIESEFYGIDSLSETLKYIYEKQIINPDLMIEGLFLNRFSKTNTVALKMLNQLIEGFEALVFKTNIPRSFLLSYQIIPETLKELKTNDLGYQGYRELASEIINKKTILA